MEFKKAIYDEETIKQLIELSYVWEKEGISWGLRHNSKEDLQELCYIATENNKIIAYTFGKYSKNDTHSSFANIGDTFFDIYELYVLPEYRNQGIGRKLFELIENEVKDQADFIVLSTATKDYQRILHFYLEEMGMDFHSAFLFKRMK